MEGPQEESREQGFFKKKKNDILFFEGAGTGDWQVLIKPCASSDELLL